MKYEPNMSQKEMARIRQSLEGTPEIEEAAGLMNLAGNSTRLKLLFHLERMNELSVSDLAEMVGVSVSAVSQHLAKLKAYGLVAPRRHEQTIRYRLTGHEFNAKLLAMGSALPGKEDTPVKKKGGGSKSGEGKEDTPFKKKGGGSKSGQETKRQP